MTSHVVNHSNHNIKLMINDLECWNLSKSSLGFAFESHHLEQRTPKKRGLLILNLAHSQTNYNHPFRIREQKSFTTKQATSIFWRGSIQNVNFPGCLLIIKRKKPPGKSKAQLMEIWGPQALLGGTLRWFAQWIHLCEDSNLGVLNVFLSPKKKENGGHVASLKSTVWEVKTMIYILDVMYYIYTVFILHVCCKVIVYCKRCIDVQDQYTFILYMWLCTSKSYNMYIHIY